MPQTVIVAGGAGFIGRHVARQFAQQGFRVIGVGHGYLSETEMHQWGFHEWRPSYITAESLRIVCKDIQPIAIIQCAGSSSVQFSYDSPYEDFNRSVNTTASILEFSKNLGTQIRVVLVSSASVYGEQGDIDMTESAESSPVSPYGFNKALAEKICGMYSRFFGVSVSIVRLFSVYGDGLRKQLLWDAMLKFKNGECKFFGTGDELRDWIHVEDAARLIFLASISKQHTYETYNGTGTQATTREILTKLADASGFNCKPVFSNEKHNGNPKRLTGCRSYVHQRLNWVPIMSLDIGVKQYANWFKSLDFK